jgi:hypothetical protein
MENNKYRNTNDIDDTEYRRMRKSEDSSYKVIMESANPAVMEALTQKEDHEMSGINQKITALYCRLSQEDERAGESLSIENQ